MVHLVSSLTVFYYYYCIISNNNNNKCFCLHFLISSLGILWKRLGIIIPTIQIKKWMHKEIIYLIFPAFTQLENGKIRPLTWNLMFFVPCQASDKPLKNWIQGPPTYVVPNMKTERLESFTKHEDAFLYQRILFYKSSPSHVGSLRGYVRHIT